MDETPHALNIEDIQDMVENELMQIRAFDVARSYITYRYKRALARQHNTTDDKILSLIEHNNEEVKQENSNKNPIVNSVQRDYMAGEVSKDLCKEYSFRAISGKLMKMVLSISMMQITLHSTCITAVW